MPDAVILTPSLSAIILDNPEMESETFLTKASEVIRAKYVNKEMDRDHDTRDKEKQEDEATTVEDKEEEEGQTGPNEPFKDESGELEEKFYDVLLFY